jgi:hypothetical protein
MWQWPIIQSHISFKSEPWNLACECVLCCCRIHLIFGFLF